MAKSKKSIKITFEYEENNEVDSLQLIIDEIYTVMPSVIGDGEIFIDSLEIEKLD